MVPKLRFKEFINPWSEFLLGDLSNLSRGKFSVRPRNDPKYFGGNMPFIQTGDIAKSEVYVEQYTQTLNELGVTVSKVFPSGTIMITIAANIGDLAILKYPMACPDSLVGIEAKKNISNNLWLMYALSLKKDELDANATQNAQKNINLQVLNALNISAPLLSEQTKIADFLSSVDEKIMLLSKQHELLCQYKKSIMQKIFSRILRFKDDNGVEFPHWQKVRLGDYLIKFNEKSSENNQYPVLTSSRGGVFFQRDYFNGEDVASKNNAGYNVVPYGYFTYRHMSDDLVFKFNINYLCKKGIVSTLYPVFTTKLNKYFLQTILNEGKEFINYAIQQKQGGSRTYMYYSKLEELNITIPNLAEQTKIANFLSALDDKITAKKAELEKLKTWKQGLLQQMFV